MSQGLWIASALLIGCASGPPAAEVATSAPADIEIAPLQPAPPSTTSAAVVATSPPPTAPPASLCDQYFVRMRACMEVMLKDAPVESRSAAMKALGDAEQQTREVFRNLEGVAHDAACQTMLDTLDQNPNCPKDAQ